MFFHAYASSSFRYCKAKSATQHRPFTTKTAMARGYAGRLQAFSKAALLGLVLLSMVTWVPHACSCLRAFLFVSLPSAASAIATPKCLFIFSNIIVLFLATESRLSRNGARSPSTSEDDTDAVVRELVAFTHAIKETHAAEEIVKAEQEVSVRMTTQQLDQCEKEEESDVALVNNVGDDLQEEVMKEEDCEEATELPTEELNRRVEDFIARFNMERQLEARMVVCCC